MRNFVLVTRGRTGSTAVIDELGKSNSLYVTHELFLLYKGEHKELRKLYHEYLNAETPDFFKLLPPFDLWKQRGWWWKRLIPYSLSDERQAHNYLSYSEKVALNQGVSGFGWKLLSHQLDERPYLSKLIRQHGYCAVYLKRSIAHQVLSGMVAKQRGIYNSLEKVVDERRYHIKPDEFRWHVEWERECVKKDIARLSAEGIDFVEVNYEDYCTNREAFYGKIFNLLDLPLELPPPSDFVKVISDIRQTIENFDEVANVATELGEAL